MNDHNLIPPKKGEVRNPNGRPKGSKNKKTIIKEWLEAVTDSENGLTAFDEMVLSMIDQAKNKGNVQAFKELSERYLGKVADKVENEYTIKGTTDIQIGSQGKLPEIE